MEAFFLHMASKLLAPRPRFLTAILTAVVGGLLAGIILAYIGGLFGIVLALVVWGFVAGAFYRIGWLRAVLLGVVAGLLFLAVRWLVMYLLDNMAASPGRT